MDTLERRLIEMNDALIELYTKGRDALPKAEQAALAAQQAIFDSKKSTGNLNISDDDVIIINNSDNCNPNPPDPPEPVECECCISNLEFYQPTKSDETPYEYSMGASTYYLGINNQYGATKVFLPEQSNELSKCPVKIIKLEMGPPIGNKKVTIEGSDGALIDGESDYRLQVPWESITLIRRGDDWHIIDHYND